MRIVHDDQNAPHLDREPQPVLPPGSRAGPVTSETAGPGRTPLNGMDSDELFRAACQASPCGMLIINPAGAIAVANARVEAIFGYREAELLGRDVELLVPPGLRGRHPSDRVQFAAHHRARAMGAGRDLIGQHKDGHEIPVEIGLAPIHRSDGTWILASIVDISIRKSNERKLAAITDRLKALMDHADDGIAVLTTGGIVVESNRRMAEMSGGSVESLLGRSILEISAGGSNAGPKAGEFAAAVANGGGQVLGVELPTPGGTPNVVDFSLSVVEIDGERLVLSIGRNVTDQRKVERQLIQAQRMEAVGRLAGGVAHDFNNLLTAIFGYTEMAMDALPADSSIRDDLDEVRKGAKRAAGLTRQLLAFSRQQVLQPRVLNLNDVLRDVEKMLGRVLGEDIELGMTLDDELKQVRADPGQLEQVVMNLVINARDAMPTGGTLSIQTTNRLVSKAEASLQPPMLPGRYVLLTVSDSGIGMLPDVQLRIFDPFFTTKEKDKGTGLGLSTAYGIVKQSGGYIWVDSEVGKGSIFSVYLPVSDAAPVDVLAATETTDRITGNETIVVAEDEPVLRRLNRLTLSSLGYTVLDAGGADEALELARRHPGPVHLLLTDVVMPGKSGRELARVLTAERPETRVLYVSGYTDDTVVRHGVYHSGTHYLQKPFTSATLAAKVRSVLDGDKSAVP